MSTIINTTQTYPAWTTVRFSASFYDVNNNLVDPTSVVLFVGGPDGSVNQYNPMRDGVGLYHTDYVTATPGGIWYYRFLGSGAVTAASDDTPFIVENPKF